MRVDLGLAWPAPRRRPVAAVDAWEVRRRPGILCVQAALEVLS